MQELSDIYNGKRADEAALRSDERDARLHTSLY